MSNGRYSEALASASVPITLNLTPLRSADRELIGIILHAVDIALRDIEGTHDTLTELYREIVEPEHTRPYFTELGQVFSHDIIEIAAWYNLRLGATPDNPIPNKSQLLDEIRTTTPLLLASLFRNNFTASSNLCPESLERYNEMSSAFNHIRSRINGFIDLSMEERLLAISNGQRHALDKWETSRDSVTLSAMAEDTNVDRKEKEEMESQHERELQNHAEANSHRRKIERHRRESLAVNSNDKGIVEMPKNEPIFKPTSFTLATEAASKENGILKDEDDLEPWMIEVLEDESEVDDPLIVAEERIIRPKNIIQKTNIKIKKETNMHHMSQSRSGLIQENRAPAQPHQPQSGLRQRMPSQDKLIQIIDCVTRQPMFCIDGRTPFMLPESSAPTIPVEQALDNGYPAFIETGEPLIICNLNGRLEQWSPEIDPGIVSQRRREASRGQQMHRSSLYNNVPEHNDEPEDNGLYSATLNERYKGAAKRREEAEAHTSVQVDNEPSEVFEEGDYRVQMRDGEILKAVLRSKTTGRSIDGFGNLGKLSEIYDVLVALDGNILYEILVEKEKLVDYDKHLGQFESIIRLGKGEGIKKEIAKEQESPVNIGAPFEVTRSVQSPLVTNLPDLLQVLYHADTDSTTLQAHSFTLETDVPVRPFLETELQALTEAIATGRDKDQEGDIYSCIAKSMRSMRPSSCAYLDGLFTKWLLDTLRYRLSTMAPDLTLDSGLEDLEDVATYASETGIVDELLELLEKEADDIFNLINETSELTITDTDNRESNEAQITVYRVQGQITLMDSVEDFEPGRVLYAHRPTLHRTITGLFSIMESENIKDSYAYIAMSSGKVLKVLRVGSVELGHYYITDIMQ